MNERKARLGDLIKSMTDKLGIEQCESCKERQEKLNKLSEDAEALIKKLLR
ncbi:MAG: hypothetical protein ACEQSB_06280 [Undibacterium sp.]